MTRSSSLLLAHCPTPLLPQLFRFLRYVRCSLLNFCLLQQHRQRAFHIHKTLSQTNVPATLTHQQVGYRVTTKKGRKKLFQIRLSVDFSRHYCLAHHLNTQLTRTGYAMMAVRIPDQGEADPFSPRTEHRTVSRDNSHSPKNKTDCFNIPG